MSTQRFYFRRKLWHMFDHGEPKSRWGLTLARRRERRLLKADVALARHGAEPE